ncbi:uncharacterized protein DUF397 [Murinocardiopsis flavida]|uniref:Uncharacterized protein DUF397 n=1 Tax=Murinocardiopsis flavida TaxID=645275 RepID=A0A2P8CMR3_9ACTN|nr:DUF397 domain-containing protein [Murinocardiopsis flavida]PSK86237.1 uncharacterized protein DUF397 [Murinocardiopsis flavida]
MSADGLSASAWSKSSYSASQSNCVEVAMPGAVLVRDTRNRELGHIAFTRAEWASFLEDVKSGLL